MRPGTIRERVAGLMLLTVCFAGVPRHAHGQWTTEPSLPTPTRVLIAGSIGGVIYAGQGNRSGAQPEDGRGAIVLEGQSDLTPGPVVFHRIVAQDEQKLPEPVIILGAAVTSTSVSDGARRAVTTNEQGYFLIPTLQPGEGGLRGAGPGRHLGLCQTGRKPRRQHRLDHRYSASASA